MPISYDLYSLWHLYSPQHFLVGQVAMVLPQFAIQITAFTMFTQYSKQNLNYISPVS